MTEMLWSGWGDPARATRLPDQVAELLQQLLGVRPAAGGGPVPLERIVPAPSALPAAARTALVSAVGPDHLRDDDETRIRHTGGKSTPDLLRIRAGDVAAAPDAIVLPGSHDEVLAVLRACTTHRVAVVPFGGGTSVTGGLAPGRRGYDGLIALDLRRLDRLRDIDTESRTATLEAGLRAPRAEEMLRERGFTLGHFPQSYEWASIGGFAATRSSGQASAGYGRFDDLVLGLTVATPRGSWELGRAPRSAAGPDLRQLVLGSEGAFGVITAVTAQVRPAPAATAYEGWRFASFDAGMTALRRLAQAGGLTPTVLRLSDETETMVGLARPQDLGGSVADAGCLLVAGYEGDGDEVAACRKHAAAVLRDGGGEPRGSEPGEAWARGRFAAPYLRDALLDVGVFAETLETATFWSRVPRLYQAVRAALTETLTARGTPPLVLCHISHVYPAGASLYFTVVCAQGDDPVREWTPAKNAANDAIVAAGGTISHHHGVGIDHRDWLAAEAGSLGIEALSAVKQRLDPAGVLNPGVLLPGTGPEPEAETGAEGGPRPAVSGGYPPPS